MDKVDREMEAAIKKHGYIQVPKPYEQEFAEEIEKKRK